MAWYLYKLGRWSFRHRIRVIAAWAALLILGGVGSVALSGETNDSFELPNTESSQAFDLIKERTPDVSTDGATARLFIQAPKGQSLADPTTQATITAALQQATTDHVASASDPFTTGTVSEDGSTAYSVISYDRIAPELTAADEKSVDEAVDTLTAGGLEAVVGGDAFVEQSHVASAEAIGIVIAFIVLAITFGSLIAAGMPLLTAVVGVGIGLLGVTTLTGFIDLSSTTPALATMLGLAVGIDYALFIMSRFKHEVQNGKTTEEAAATAVGTAGSAVVFAGLTVIIALAGLSITGITFLTQMGLAAAATVAIAVLIALTLLPAILSLSGRRVSAGRTAKLKGEHLDEAGQHLPGGRGRTNGRRWVDLVTRFRVPALIVGVGAAVAMSIPVASMELALPDDGSKPTDTSQRQAYDLLADNFGEGSNGPLTVVIDTKNATDPVAAATAAVAKLETVKADVAAIQSTVPDPSDPEAVAAFSQQLDAVGYTAVQVIPNSGPSDAATKDLVLDIRDTMKDLPAETGARALVTGQTAAGVDISQSLLDAFPKYLLVVVGLALILLVLVFRSILVPVKAIVGFLASLGISLGATVAVFQWGWLQGLIGLDAESPVIFILPLLLTGILFGLAMDYEVFLVSRMREEYVHGMDARDAVVVGFQHSARVVTAAALIMMGVFAGFALAPDPIIKSIGFALTIGVLADAFLVRMLLVPALMSVVGKNMWWIPAWLDRIMPNVDIEGESLARHLAAAEDPAETEQVPVPVS